MDTDLSYVMTWCIDYPDYLKRKSKRHIYSDLLFLGSAIFDWMFDFYVYDCYLLDVHNDQLLRRINETTLTITATTNSRPRKGIQ